MNPSPFCLAFGAGDWPTEAKALSGSPRYHLWGLALLGWDVLFVNPPKRPRVGDALRDFPLPKSATGRLRILSPGIVPPFAVRHAPLGRLGTAWRFLTSRLIVAAARRHLDRIPDVVWCGAPWHAPIARTWAGQAPVVHHVYDELVHSPIYTTKESKRLDRWEKELLETAALTLCSSTAQLERRRPLSDRLHLLPNAVRDDFLGAEPSEAGRAIAEKLAAHPFPRIVYGGVADQRLDPDYFVALAAQLRERGQGILVFAGTKSDRLDPRIARLEGDPRVLFTGSLPYSDFPAIYTHADALVLAHHRDRFTDAMYPEKLNEYLMVGRRVVAVDMPEVERIAGELPPDAIKVVHSPEQFITACLRPSTDNEVELSKARQAWAMRHTWNQTALDFDRVLRSLMGKRSGLSAESVKGGASSGT